MNSLLNYCGNDFEVWESQQSEEERKYYNLSIEGYVGFEKLIQFVDLYKEFLEYLEKYLVDNNTVKTKKHTWKSLYQTRAMKICYDHGCYWIFLEPYKSTEIWDLYYYMEDVISQTESYINKNI